MLFTVKNDHGETCGHQHRGLSAAVRCRKALDRIERDRSGRYGSARLTWTVEAVTDVTRNTGQERN